MTKKSFPPAAFSHQGVDFRMCYTYPAADKHKDMPCRGRINPLDPMTGKCLTKRQLFGKDSDAPVNHIVHGKDPWDVYSKREAAANYLISVMVQRGLLSGVAVSVPDEDANLAELARNYKQTLFDIHPRWMKSTVQKYSSQYDIMVEELAGLRAGDLDDAAYKQLQEKICRNAARDATKHNTWSYGEVPPSSARTRLFLLYELIRCLMAEGVSIPVVPFPYNGKPSRQMLLLNRTDHARMIPDAILRAICADPVIQGQAEILADAGLRIGECTGILFDSLRWLAPPRAGCIIWTSAARWMTRASALSCPRPRIPTGLYPFPGNLGKLLRAIGKRWRPNMATFPCVLCADKPTKTGLTTVPPKQPPGKRRCAHESRRCCVSPPPSRRSLPIAFIFSTNKPKMLSCTPSFSLIHVGAIPVPSYIASAG